MRQLSRAMSSWSPAMWANLAAMSALAFAASDSWTISVVGGGACFWLSVMSLVVTLKEGQK